MLGHLWREGRRRIGQGEDDQRQPRGHAAAQQRRQQPEQRPRGRRARRRFAGTQAHRGPDHQDAGQPAADGRLGQRRVDRRQAHPGERQQQAVGRIADARGEGVAHRDRPYGHCQDEDDEHAVEEKR